MSQIEIYLSQLVLAREASQIVVSNYEGLTIVCALSDPNIGPQDTTAKGIVTLSNQDPTSDSAGSNVAISGARSMAMFSDLGLMVPSFLTAHYHDHIVVQCLVRPGPGGQLLLGGGTSSEGVARDSSGGMPLFDTTDMDKRAPLNKSTIVSIVGQRSQDHSVGGLMALAHTLLKVPSFQELVKIVANNS